MVKDMDEIKKPEELVKTPEERAKEAHENAAKMIFLSVAHASCQLVDPDLQSECKEWAEHLDPLAIEDHAEIAYQLIGRHGGKGIQNSADIFNEGSSRAILRKVNELLQAGKTLDQIRQEDGVLVSFYEQILKREGGI
jgi:hypothetical protein